MKLHPLTVIYRGFSRGAALASVGFFAGSSLSGAADLPSSSLLALPLAVLGFLAGFGYEFARYRRFDYELVGDALHLQSGVLSRRRREIPLRRVQNVDVTRSVVQRVLGIATVSIETAGGGQTEASLQCVGVEEARRIQTTLREQRRAAKTEEREATREAEEAEKTGKPERPGERGKAEEAEEREQPVVAERETLTEPETLFDLSNRELLTLSVLSFDPRAVSAVFFLAPFIAPVVTGAVGGLTGGALVAVGVVLVAGLVLALWLIGAAATFVQFYGFRLLRQEGELRYERGLLQRRDGSIPLDKLQTLTVEENVLMRQFGYAALAVETAGYAPGQSPSGGSEAAVPLASREHVLKLAQEIEAFEVPEFDRPPERAQRRYIGRYALVALGLVGVAGLVDTFVVDLGPWYLASVLALAAPLAARARWRNLGYALGDRHVFAREGFWRRRTAIVPYYRVQTVITRRTIFQRRWNLSTLVFDTAGSQGLRGQDARFVDVDEEEARTRCGTARERLVAALRERR